MFFILCFATVRGNEKCLSSFLFLFFCQVWANQDLIREQTKELAAVRYYTQLLQLIGMVPDFSTWNSFSWSQIFKILFDIQVSGHICAVELLSCSEGLTELCTMRKLLIYLLVAIHYQQLICHGWAYCAPFGSVPISVRVN